MIGSIAWMTAAIVAVLIVLLYLPLVLLVVGSFVGLFALMWALGVPIVVTKNGKKIGYYKWLTFYRNE
jgi:hypothetical protein